MEKSSLMDSMRLTATLCFCAGAIMLLIHLTGLMSIGNEFLIAALILMGMGGFTSGVLFATKRLYKDRIKGDLSQLHSEIEEFLKSTDTSH